MRQVGDRFSELLILLLELLEPLHLVRLQATDFLTPPVVSELRLADRPHGLSNRLALRLQKRRPIATISSGLCFFWGIPSSSIRLERLLQGGPLFRGRAMLPS